MWNKKFQKLPSVLAETVLFDSSGSQQIAAHWARKHSHNSPDTVGCRVEGSGWAPEGRSSSSSTSSRSVVNVGYGTSVDGLDSAVVSVSLAVGHVTGIFALDEGHQVGTKRHSLLKYGPADTFSARWGSERALITEEFSHVKGIDEVLERDLSVFNFVVFFCTPVSARGPDILV